MINKCDDCIMSNCCEEFECGCEQVQKYGKAIEQKVRADAIDEFMKEFEQKSEDIINAWCKDINLPKPTLARGLALARGIAEKVKGAEQ